MKRRTLAGGGLAALAAAAGFGGLAIAGDDGSRELAERKVAETRTATQAGPVTRAGAGKKIQTFYDPDELVPGAGDEAVVGLRCPRGEGNAIGGGAATRQGVDIVYLSQLNPETFETSPRAYYVGIENEDGAAANGAFIEVYCAERIAVRK
jgi:hypothetical protein